MLQYFLKIIISILMNQLSLQANRASHRNMMLIRKSQYERIAMESLNKYEQEISRNREARNREINLKYSSMHLMLIGDEFKGGHLRNIFRYFYDMFIHNYIERNEVFSQQDLF